MVVAMSLLCILPAFAAPAQVEITKTEGSFSVTSYQPNLDKTFNMDYDYSERYQVVTNDNGSFIKRSGKMFGTAVDVATNEVYHISDCYNETTKAEFDSASNEYTFYEHAKFVGPGPDNNLFATFKVTMKDGVIIKNIANIEIK